MNNSSSHASLKVSLSPKENLSKQTVGLNYISKYFFNFQIPALNFNSLMNKVKKNPCRNSSTTKVIVRMNNSLSMQASFSIFIHSDPKKNSTANEIYQEGSALHNALYFNGTKEEKLKAIHNFVKNGGDINLANSRGKSPLYYALYFSSNESCTYEIVSLLFKYGVKVNYREFQEGSPLHDVLYYVGTKESKLEAIKALVENGVDVNSINFRGMTPLHYANYFNSNADFRKEIIEELKKHDARL